MTAVDVELLHMVKILQRNDDVLGARHAP